MASECASEEPVSSGTGGQEQESGRKEKDARGGRFDSRFLGSLVTAGALLVVAIVGAWINLTIASAQQTSDAFAHYANRETAVNSLRAEVFGVLAQSVITELKDPEFRKVALLAAYHGSFSQFMDTRPVFEAILKEILGPAARHELRRLAKRVARRQADDIVAHGGVRDRHTMHWRPGSGNERCVFKLRGHELHVLIEEVRDKDDDGKKRPAGDIANTVDVVLDVDGEEPSFSVSYLDAPYIDNIFLVHPQNKIHRIALLLLDITKTDDGGYDVTLEALHFPENSILPGDVPSAQEIQKAVNESGSHESKEHHDTKSS